MVARAYFRPRVAFDLAVERVGVFARVEERVALRELVREPFEPFEPFDRRFATVSTFLSASCSSFRFCCRSRVTFASPSVRAIVSRPVYAAIS